MIAEQKVASKDRGMKTTIIIASIIGGICAIVAALITVWCNRDGGPFTGTNILILNACELKNAEITLKDMINKKYPKAIVVAKDKDHWEYNHEMRQTEIYYITPIFKKEAMLLEEWFPGKQDVIDYQNQSKMFGLEQRNVVIFIGNDYQEVFKAI